MQHYPKAVIFDLDGTLIDSVPAIRATLNSVFLKEGIGALDIEEVRGLVGFGAKWMLQEIINRKGIVVNN